MLVRSESRTHDLPRHKSKISKPLTEINEDIILLYRTKLQKPLKEISDEMKAMRENLTITEELSDVLFAKVFKPLSKAAFTRTLFHLKPHRFRCGYAFCLHDTDRDRCRNRVDLKTLPKVERFQNDTDLSDV